jgi:ABC-type phosphate transport system substrate-binding protein
MKKTLLITLLCTLALTLCACGGNTEETDADPSASGGQINVTVQNEDSALYTEEDIDAAAETVIEYFGQNFDGCTLTKLGYPGDDEAAFRDWADQYGADEAIVLTSEFDVDETGGDGSLEANSTYTDWQWVLVRTAGGDWEHATHGYA